MKQIPLTQGQVALVDDEDYDYLSQWKWFAQYCPDTGGFYASRRVKQESSGRQGVILMHRLLMNPHKNNKIDHINRNGLDNQKSNLRECTPAQNSHNRKRKKPNTSGYPGVFRNGNGWIAKMVYKGKHVSFGTFPTPEEANVAYINGSIALHGEFSIYHGEKYKDE